MEGYYFVEMRAHCFFKTYLVSRCEYFVLLWDSCENIGFCPTTMSLKSVQHVCRQNDGISVTVCGRFPLQPCQAFCRGQSPGSV